MKQMMMKAKAGVTLVELLVVILIVTILSVSLLPLLKPYIVKAQYAAEPIPVLANLQTKIELYQYEKGLLPGEITSTANITTADYYTWFLDKTTTPNTYQPLKKGEARTSTEKATSGHFQHLTDTDWQDLTGKNMRPSDFQYIVTKNEKTGSYCYAVGVFGGHDNSGLAAGTGYAVCKIVDLASSNKVVAVWECYKPKDNNATTLHFNVAQQASQANDSLPWVPLGSMINGVATWQNVTNILANAGWSF